MTREFTVSVTCPHCGQSSESRHDAQAMQGLYGNDPTITVLCTHCQANFAQPLGLACAEWDDYCQEIPLPADV
jgi:endogenous inhibitor of DNA gyrase (YacG/DUF329 family)